MPGGKTRPETESGKHAGRPAKAESGVARLAVIRIRGSVNVRPAVRDTLKMLRLNRVNHCVLVPDNPAYQGMLKKAGNYLAWGEIDRKTLEALVTKRGRLPGDKKLEKEDIKLITEKLIGGAKEEKIKPVFRLSPPSKGFDSVRRQLPRGDLGNRGEKINELLKRMI